MSLDLEDSLDKIKAEFDSLESFIESDETKGDRFKTYLKKFYDYLKVNDDVLNESTTIANKFESMPELIVDKNLVDNEQIYQQLQLYNNDTSSSVTSLAKFFSKCLVSIDSMSFSVELKKNNTNGDLANSTATENLDSNDGEDEQDNLNSSDQDSDDDVLSDDSIENLLKNSKMKAEIKNKEKNLANRKEKNKKIEFGIPEGSDSEISDFDVDENGKDDGEDDDEQEEEEENGLEEDDEEDEGEDEEDEENGDIDSDEVDEDLVDLFTDLGDEKEVMGIGKPAKSFNQVDFDREDFGLNDEDEEKNEEDYDNELTQEEKTEIKKQQKKTKDLFAANESDDEKDETKEKSSFEIRQSKLKDQVEDIHKTMLNELTDKPWQLQGESTAKSRPKESLLEEYLDFDHTTRQAPITSAKTTEELEALIKQRIKDKAFDDVERKVKPVDMQYEYKKQVVLNQEKSKLGLSEVYEQEFLKQQNGSEKSNDQANPKHEEIRKQMQNLFMKLDALSNFHYTPKAPAPEIKVISNMPTITMEEVAPVSVADTNIFAPEEVKSNIKSLPKSKSEEDKKDKKKNLRTKKILGKKKKAKKEELLRVKQALNPNDPKLAKEAAMNKLVKQSKNKSQNIKILKQDKKEKVNNAYRSSHAFFQQLQETNQLGSKIATKKRLNDSSSDKNKLTSKKLKL